MYLLGHQGVTELRKNAKHAVNQSSINQEDVKAVLFNLPPPAEQREIVRRVKRLFALADRLEARYEKATAQVARLTQSMLAKAFRGELVPTEAELARWQGREYETAEQLLARIKTNEGQNTTAPLRRRATVGVR
jgi:type I restriction enzyme S subunit